MRMNGTRWPNRALVLVFLAFVSMAQPAFGADKKTKNAAKTATLSEHDRALHALQRLTFGPRPGDIEKVLSLGVDKWIAQQLDPAQIPDPAIDAKLGPYRTLRMQPRDLAQTFPSNQMVREAAE